MWISRNEYKTLMRRLENLEIAVGIEMPGRYDPLNYVLQHRVNENVNEHTRVLKALMKYLGVRCAVSDDLVVKKIGDGKLGAE